MNYTAAVITISDKGSRGERIDTSGPALAALLTQEGYEVVHTAILPDEKDLIADALIKCADEKQIALVLTTGGTGFAVRDVTPEATRAVIERETPGIPEAMRAESLRITPRGCLSRSAAGIRKKTLIINLPGSEKAAKENILAVLPAVKHGLETLYAAGSSECGVPVTAKKKAPSVDAWMREAKADPSAARVGMYLVHNGVVRQTPRAQVREGAPEGRMVSGMRFSYDEAKVSAAVAEARQMEGIAFIRVWLNSGVLEVGDDIMTVMIGGDIRPHVIDCLQTLVGRIKRECVSEQELIDEPQA